MRAIAKYRIGYVLFSVLLLYATTADFIATSVVIAEGHDCNHPALRIEHKCVTTSVRTSHVEHSAISTVHVAHSNVSISDPGEYGQSLVFVEFSAPLNSEIPQDATPLRC